MAPRAVVRTETPSERIIKAAQATADVTDTRGRTLRIRKVNALMRMDFAEVMGPERIKNESLAGMAMLAFTCAAIDGDPVVQPSNYQEMRALVGRLDEDGIEAVGEGHVEHFGVAAATAASEADLKN